MKPWRHCNRSTRALCDSFVSDALRIPNLNDGACRYWLPTATSSAIAARCQGCPRHGFCGGVRVSSAVGDDVILEAPRVSVGMLFREVDSVP